MDESKLNRGYGTDRDQDKTGTDRNQVIQYRPKNGHNEYFSVPILDRHRKVQNIHKIRYRKI
jgi:hypothetical protein